MKLTDVQVNENFNNELTDEQFELLKQEIKKAMINLNRLQKIYRAQTGRDYTPFR